MNTNKLLLFVLSFFVITSVTHTVQSQGLSTHEKLMFSQNRWAFIDAKLLSEIHEYGDSAPAFLVWLSCALMSFAAEEYAFQKLTPPEALPEVLEEASELRYSCQIIIAAMFAVFPTRLFVTMLNEISEANALTNFLNNYPTEYEKFLPVELKPLFDELYRQYKSKDGVAALCKIAHEVINHVKTMPRVNVVLQTTPAS